MTGSMFQAMVQCINIGAKTFGVHSTLFLAFGVESNGNKLDVCKVRSGWLMQLD